MAAQIQIDASDLLREAEEIRKAGGRIPDEIRDGMKKAVRVVQREVQTKLQETGLQVRTGTLSRGMRSRILRRGLEGVVDLRKNAFYGRFHDTGTVKHRARPFFAPAAESSLDEVEKILLDSAMKAFPK